MFVERDVTASEKRVKKKKCPSLSFSVSQVDTSKNKSQKINKSAKNVEIKNKSAKKEKKEKKSLKPTDELSVEVKDENDLNYLKLLLNNKDELDEFKGTELKMCLTLILNTHSVFQSINLVFNRSFFRFHISNI